MPTLVAGTRTYANTAASEEYVMRFGSLSDITAFTGTYVINATTPTAGNLFPQGGADKYVIELVNVIDPVTGQPKWPLVFPALALTSSTTDPGSGSSTASPGPRLGPVFARTRPHKPPSQDTGLLRPRFLIPAGPDRCASPG